MRCKYNKIILSILGGLLVTANSLNAQEGPSFKRGELAVYGSPGDLSEYAIIKYLPNAGISVIAVQPGSEQRELAKLKSKGKKGGLNRLATKFLTPNDTFYSFQWHFDKVQATAAWDLTDGSTVTIAVLDTGLASGASDSIGCVSPGADIVNNDGDPEDGDGHGTHVSGTIGQTTNNGTGVAGLAYGSCIMPVKVLSDTGSGTSADIAEGIYLAVNSGAKVINMSLGFNARFGIRNDALLDPALEYANANGVTVVCASGNDGHRKNVSYPAIYPTTIAVGATDLRNNVTRYSNKGEGLDLVAPGGNTGRDDNRDGYVDGVLQETRIDGSWGYYFFEGTSMASPHVAAAAAMLISRGVAITPDEVRETLKNTALDLGDSGYDSNYGAGLLQVADALSGNATQPPPGETCTDEDGDGFCAINDPVENDCNDNNSAVFPGANDTRGKKGRDGIDNDCDGIIDQ